MDKLEELDKKTVSPHLPPPVLAENEKAMIVWYMMSPLFIKMLIRLDSGQMAMFLLYIKNHWAQVLWSLILLLRGTGA